MRILSLCICLMFSAPLFAYSLDGDGNFVVTTPEDINSLPKGAMVVTGRNWTAKHVQAMAENSDCLRTLKLTGTIPLKAFTTHSSVFKSINLRLGDSHDVEPLLIKKYGEIFWRVSVSVSKTVDATVTQLAETESTAEFAPNNVPEVGSRFLLYSAGAVKAKGVV